MQKRHPTLTIIYAIFTILSVCIERPVYLLRHTIIQNNMLTDIHLIIYHFTIFPLSYLLTLRYWMIYFNVNWIKATIDKKWKIHLNPIQTEENFYLKSKSTWGNLSWSLKRFCLIIILIDIISLISMLILSTSMYTLISLLLNVAPIFIIFYLFFKIRQHNDDFHILKELKIIIFLVIFSVMRYIVIGFLPIFGIDIYFRYLFLSVFSSIFMPMYLYFQTLFIVYTINHTDNQRDILQLTNHTSRSTSKSSVEMSDSNSPISLRDTLKNEDLFESFMQHVTREWSTELLLSFIEITQLQNVIKQTYFNDDNTIQLQRYQIAILENKAIPESYIVHTKSMIELLNKCEINDIKEVEVEKDIEFKMKSYILYKKYIDDCSELQINISGKQKNKLQDCMDEIDMFIQLNIKKKELFSIYTDVINELAKLLRYSYDRFTFSDNDEIM
eukprot:401956_1